MQQELLEALKTIRHFFAGLHANERLFVCAFHGKYHNQAAKTPRPFPDQPLYDKDGKWLLTKEQERELEAWAKSQFGSNDFEKPGLDQVSTYLKLIPPMRAACDDALRILTTNVEQSKLPDIEIKALKTACMKLKSSMTVATYTAAYSQLFNESIDVLELHSPKPERSQSQFIEDSNKVPFNLQGCNQHFIDQLNEAFRKHGHAWFSTSEIKTGKYSDKNKELWIDFMEREKMLISRGYRRGTQFQILPKNE